MMTSAPDDLNDPFGSPGAKLSYLMGLRPGCPVSVVGPWATRLDGDLATLGLRVTQIQSPNELAVGSAEAGILDLRAVAAPAVESWFRALERLPGNPVLVVTGRAEARRLALGPMAAQVYRPWPVFPGAEAFHLEGRSSPMPRNDEPLRHRLFRRLNWFGFGTNARLAFLGGSEVRPGARLFAGWPAAGGFDTERFFLRRRGALILVAGPKGPGPRSLIRVGVGSRVAATLRRNTTTVTTILAWPEIPRPVAELLPRPLASWTVDDAEAFAEEYRDGALAWTLRGVPSVRSRLERAAFDFTHSLQTATAKPVEWNEGSIRALVLRDLDRLIDRAELDQAFGAELRDLRQAIGRLAEGLRVPVCVGHGDYGFGNLLARPTGELSAVIDWDLAVWDDLPGVDWCDHRIKEHFAKTAHWGDAVALVAEEVRVGGCLAPAFDGFGPADFGHRPEDLMLFAALAGVRNFARGLPYGAEFRSIAEGLKTALPTIRSVVQSAAAPA